MHRRLRYTPAQRYQMFQDYLVRRAAEVTRNNLSGIRDLQEWKLQRPAVLKRFLYVLSLDPMPAKTPLNARITKTLCASFSTTRPPRTGRPRRC